MKLGIPNHNKIIWEFAEFNWRGIRPPEGLTDIMIFAKWCLADAKRQFKNSIKEIRTKNVRVSR